MANDSDNILRHLPHTIADYCRKLPSDWNLSYLDSLVTQDAPICYGILMPGNDIEGGIPVIKVKNFRNGKIDAKSLLRTTPEIDEEYKRSRIASGDLLLSIRGSVGFLAVADESVEGANITQDTARIRLNGTSDHSLVFHTLQSQLLRRQISLNTIGQAVTGINIREVRRLVVPLPPLDEQQKIAAILSTWDRAIELTEKLIAAKRQRKQALMQQLLTGKVRLPGFVKSDEKQPTRYGEIPSEWGYVRISKVAVEVKAKNTEGHNHQVLSCTKYDGLVDSLDYFGRQIFSDDLSTYKLVQRNQFAYATNHIEEGSIGYQNVCDTAVISPMYTVFETKESVDDGFLYKLLKSDLYVHIYQVNTSASVNRRGSLRWSAFSRIRIPIPSLDEQRAIAEVIDCQQHEIDLLVAKLDALQRQKKGLMQQLLTGKIRVNVDAEKAEAGRHG